VYTVYKNLGKILDGRSILLIFVQSVHYGLWEKSHRNHEMANKNMFSKSYFTYFLTCHRRPRRVHILKFRWVWCDISHIYDHFCHPGCPPHISGTATAVVTKLAQYNVRTFVYLTVIKCNRRDP